MSPTETPPRRPTAFRLDAVQMAEDSNTTQRAADRPLVIPEIDDSTPVLTPVVQPEKKSGWTKLLGACVGVLVSLGIGLAVDSLIRDLFARAEWLGWFATGVATLGVVALAAIVVREIAGVVRLKHISKLRLEAERAAAADDRPAAQAIIRELSALYSERPDTARGRAALAAHAEEIIDGRDLIGLSEHELLQTLDNLARTLVLSSAKRVTVITAISPRALVDVVFVLISALRLIRQLGQLYGGRPGTLGFLRLTRSVVAHLAVTGGMAAGDSIVQQFLGHGIAARLSARLGEGVINGILTARVGIAAIDVCRPLPFLSLPPPTMGDFIAELTKMKDNREL